MDENQDLATRVAEVEEALSDLRADLDTGSSRRRRRVPGLRDLLRVTEEYTIPTAIASLEATIAALELLREVLRVADPDRRVGTGTGGATRAVDAGARASSSAAAVGAAALDRLDDALADLQRELEAGSLPDDPEARAVVEDARELRDDIRERIEGGTAGDADREDAIRIDVEEELQTIRDEVEDRDADDGGDDR